MPPLAPCTSHKEDVPDTLSMTKPTIHTESTPPASLRTCVGSRQTLPPQQLERFVLIDGQLVFDMRRRAPGRGVWLKPELDCVRRALKKGGFHRGFGQRVELPDESELVEMLRQGIARRLRESLHTTARARALAVGQDAVSDAMRRNTAQLIALASDAGESTRTKFSSNARRKSLRLIEVWNGEELGHLVSRDYVSIVAVTDASLAERVVTDIEKLRALGAIEG